MSWGGREGGEGKKEEKKWIRGRQQKGVEIKTS